jgi:hypothetical protein
MEVQAPKMEVQTPKMEVQTPKSEPYFLLNAANKENSEKRFQKRISYHLGGHHFGLF